MRKDTEWEKIKTFLDKEGCNWIQTKFITHVPYASHYGGVWERLIRSTRSILDAMLLQTGSYLDDDCLRTIFYEVASILNSRPLSLEIVSDPFSDVPVSPNQLLTMKTSIVVPPPGCFRSDDLYHRKRWRRVQHLVNEFWKKWKSEYLQILQRRQKWRKEFRNIKVGDIVLLKEDTPRNCWPLARVSEVFPSEDGMIRRVRLKVGKSEYQRPISKLVLLMEKS